MLDQLCRTADDDAARRLGALLLHQWPAPETDKHAVQVVGVIGTDTAPARQAKAPGWRRRPAGGARPRTFWRWPPGRAS